MKKTDLRRLAKFVRQIGAGKPVKPLRMPPNPPPKQELERKWKLVEKPEK